ncbi:MAG: branched-chain amino acid aminotransferase [Candidatus Schekmanbacteria bacterium]|nr:branched-chain amino acid aminotransferase [Candidatus Schekmanbacteria bacterium]
MGNWQTLPFGAVLLEQMATSSYRDGQWSEPRLVPSDRMDISPAAHVLHYSSTCFEGLKAYRWRDGSIHAFRMDMHVARMCRSAALLCLPEPPAELVARVIRMAVDAGRAGVPDLPAALYIRPTLIGTNGSIGSAGKGAEEALLYVLVSPVGPYFKTGAKGLTVLLEQAAWRTTPGFGMAKTGANYASSLRRIMQAKREQDADQIVFAPGGIVQETGAANVFLLAPERVLTPAKTEDFLHGVTRDSLLRLAARQGYRTEERQISADELLRWCATSEIALSGTAAVLAGVGTVIADGVTHQLGDGGIGPVTARLRQALVDIQSGTAADELGWLTEM